MSEIIGGRAAWGRAAIAHGTPDLAGNDTRTNAVDAVTNIMHAVAADGERELGVEVAAAEARGVIESAGQHFDAEHGADDLELDGGRVSHPPGSPVVLVIRDPDYENTYIVDGQIQTIDIDLGSSFNGPRYFQRDLDEGSQAEWLADTRAQVADLPEDSNVRQAVESLCDSLESGDDD